jgi:hypothetical protein
MKRAFLPGCTLLVLFILVACGSTPSTPTPVDVSSLQTHAVETAYADLTRNAPIATFTPTATLTPTITPTFTPTLTPTITPTPTEVKLSLENNLAIYMINVEDQENCKYYTFPIPINRGITGDMIADTAMSIRYLLGTHWLESGILINPLGTASLEFVKIDYSGTHMDIHLTGLMSRYDDTCTNNEARDQLWATAKRFVPPDVTVEIWVEDLLFDDYMIGR